MSDLREYLTEAGELPEDVVLGWIVMWSVLDFEPGITLDSLKALFAEFDLDPALLPPAPKQVDAFRKATSAMTVKLEVPLADGNVATYLSRDVKADVNYIERHIIREVRDASTRTLSYSKAMTATFYRAVPDKNRKVKPASGRVRFIMHPENYPAEEASAVEDLRNEMAAAFAVYETHIDAQRIRTLIRDYVTYLNAIQLKSAVYFVNQAQAKELHRFGALVGRLPGECSMNLLPLIDLPNARSMVIDAFQKEAADAMTEIVRRCQELKSKKRVTPEQYALVRQDFDKVMNQATEYLKLLEINQDMTGASAEVALEALQDLAHVMISSQDWSPDQ